MDDPRPTLLCNGVRTSGDIRGGSPHDHWATCEYGRLGLATPSFAMAAIRICRNLLCICSVCPATREAPPLIPTPSTGAKVCQWMVRSADPAVAIADLADPNSFPMRANLVDGVDGRGGLEARGINLVHELVHSALSSPRPWFTRIGPLCRSHVPARAKWASGRARLSCLHGRRFLTRKKKYRPFGRETPREKRGQPLATTFDESYYRSKAAYVWWMLRDMVGDEALKQPFTIIELRMTMTKIQNMSST